MPTRALALLLGWLAAACAPRSTKFVFLPPPTAEAISLLGDTLWSLPIEPGAGPALVFRLDEARDRVTQSPGSIDARLALGRRTEEMGRLRGAIRVYSEAMEELLDDRRLWWRRGRLLLQIREIDLAIRDFQYAAQAGFNRTTDGATEFEALRSGQGVAVTTMLYSTYYYLGFAYYLRGEFAKAQVALGKALEEAASTDETIATIFWLFLASRRAGAHADAARILEVVDPEVQLNYARPELNLLLAFRGSLEVNELPVDLGSPVIEGDEALYAYGIAVGLILLDRADEAALLFERIREGRDWTTWPVLASEADLARLKGVPE